MDDDGLARSISVTISEGQKYLNSAPRGVIYSDVVFALVNNRKSAYLSADLKEWLRSRSTRTLNNLLPIVANHQEKTGG